MAGGEIERRDERAGRQKMAVKVVGPVIVTPPEKRFMVLGYHRKITRQAHEWLNASVLHPNWTTGMQHRLRGAPRGVRPGQHRINFRPIALNPADGSSSRDCH